jgi:DNA-binding IclR family transcriptional regulator
MALVHSFNNQPVVNELTRSTSTSSVEDQSGDSQTATGKGWLRFVEGVVPAGAEGTVRIAALLKIIAAHNTTGLKLIEIAELAGLEQSTSHRIVTALHSVNFISKEPTTKRYHLGPLLFELFSTAFPYFNLREVARPVIEQLAEQLGETTYLSTRSGFDSICTDRCLGTKPIRTCTVEIGQRRALGLGAGSLAILAALPNHEVQSIIEHNLKRYSQYDITLEQILERVERAKQQGFVHQTALTSNDVYGVGLPILGKTGYVFGALSVSAITLQMNEERISIIAKELEKAALDIQSRIAVLGYV